MKLWEGLEQELNYNVMVSQRGVCNLFHSDAQRDALCQARQHDAHSRRRRRTAGRGGHPPPRAIPGFRQCALSHQGRLLQKRGGTARHDAVVWCYARGADSRGVDIIQNCEVTGLIIEGGVIKGVETTRGTIGAKKVGLAVAGNSSRLGAMAGLRLPIETCVLQAMVTEGISR